MRELLAGMEDEANARAALSRSLMEVVNCT